MNQRFCRLTALAALALATSVDGAFASTLTECRVGIAAAIAGDVRAHHALVDDCLRNGDYSQTSSFCGDHLSLFSDAYDEMEAALDGPDSTCAVAILEGATLEDIHSPQCPAGFQSCDSIVVDDLDAIQSCISCNLGGLEAKRKRDVDYPTTAPESLNEQKCLRSLQRMMGKAARSGLRETVRCVGAGNGDCPLDASSGGRFAKGIRKIATKAARCRDGDGNLGTAGGTLSTLCNSAVATAEELGACLGRAVTCQACLASDLASGQDHDCATISGDRSCRLAYGWSFGTPDAGSFFVANQGDSTVTFFQPDGQYAAGNLAASSTSVGAPPSDIVLASSTNTLFAVSTSGNSVTALDAATRAPIGATLASSTTMVGSLPSSAAVHEVRQILYVANEADDTLTMLDAADGSYLHDTLAASTVPAGDAPAAVVVDAYTDTVYVANSGSDSVLFLEAATGLPRFGTLALSNFPVCEQPRALSLQQWWHGAKTLFVACSGDSGVVALDWQTGAEAPYPAARTLAGAPSAMVAHEYGGFATLPGSHSVTGWDWYNSWPALEGEVASATLPSAANPSDLAISIVGEIYGGGYFDQTGEFLLSLSKDGNVAQKSPIYSNFALLGVSAFERSSVDLDVYGALVPNDSTGVLYALNNDGVVFLDADTLDVVDSVPLSLVADLAYDAGRNVLYAYRNDGGVTMIDGTTGDFVHGDVASSTFTCGCNFAYRMAINPVAGRLYLTCDSYIAYMDADTGACVGGNDTDTGYGDYYFCGLAPDIAGGRLLVGGCKNPVFGGSGQGTVFMLDDTDPQFTGGTQQDSILATGMYAISEMEVGPLTHRLYIATSRNFVLRDAGTGEHLATGLGYSSYRRFELDEANDVVRVIEEDNPVSDGSRLAYLNATSLQVDSVLNLGLTPFGIATNAGTTTIQGTGRLVQVDPFQAEFRLPDPILSEETYTTGPAPVSIAVVPPPAD